CADPHDNEVYALFDLELSEYPGDESIFDLAFDACLDRFEPFVGHDYETSSLDIYAMYPTEQGWTSLNDREVVCALYDVDASKLSGTMRGSGV
ncbi:MAG: septum formation family protein, partial [Gammaproteobacteria bacterium]